ncbi:unnamed protein product [Phytophthora fragariaefolia]|uniref:Unnamed protein product n=1 Tax=Phytophthora fragariaefolia TaxID=1490495 RepID=A0A9W6YJN9_9STRA|nr:unnamed protein product [Phytophthora fragariaefolia]
MQYGGCRMSRGVFKAVIVDAAPAPDCLKRGGSSDGPAPLEYLMHLPLNLVSEVGRVCPVDVIQQCPESLGSVARVNPNVVRMLSSEDAIPNASHEKTTHSLVAPGQFQKVGCRRDWGLQALFNRTVRQVAAGIPPVKCLELQAVEDLFPPPSCPSNPPDLCPAKAIESFGNSIVILFPFRRSIYQF